jgi:hypothetical protein
MNSFIYIITRIELMKKIIPISFLFIACTQNEKAKKWGGTAEIKLPKGQKLINVTWKDTDLWYLTRPMQATDSAVTYSFKEKSTYGIAEGTYIIHEEK